MFLPVNSKIMNAELLFPLSCAKTTIFQNPLKFVPINNSSPKVMSNNLCRSTVKCMENICYRITTKFSMRLSITSFASEQLYAKVSLALRKINYRITFYRTKVQVHMMGVAYIKYHACTWR